MSGYISTVKPSVVKLCHCAGLARAVNEASPDTLIVYRKVENDWHQYIYGYDDMRDAAWAFIEWLWPELEELETALGGQAFAVEGLNETIACGAVEDIRRVVEFEAEFAYQLSTDAPFNARPVVLNTAVGNPEHGSETEMLVPAVREAIVANGYVGYHAYWPSRPGHTWLESDWEHFAGRWAASWDTTFREHNLRPRYILTEGGPVGESNTHLNPGAGWRVCCSDWPEALQQHATFDQLARQSVPGQEGRYIGITLFTVAGGEQWRHFAYKRPQFDGLIDAFID